MSLRPERGTTLLDCIVSLGTASLVLSIIAVLAGRISAHAASLIGSGRAKLASAATYIAVNTALSSADTHRLSIGVKVSPDGVVALLDGSPHPLMKIRGTSAPRPRSDVLSVMALASEHAARAIETAVDGDRYTITACWERERPEDLDFRSYVAYSPEGAFQMAGEALRVSGGCYRVTGRFISSLFVGASPPNAGIISLFPVRHEYSVYVDRTGHLRLVSHVGRRIIENQPLVRGIERIRFKPMGLGLGVEGIGITLKPVASSPVSWNHLYRLSRSSLWHQIFM